MDGKADHGVKFRSMKVMENDKVVTQATQNDPRVTRVGNFPAPHLAGRAAAVYQRLYWQYVDCPGHVRTRLPITSSTAR